MIPLSELVDVNPPPPRQVEKGPLSVIAVPDIDLLTGTAHPRAVSSEAEAGSARRHAKPGDVVFARISPSMENGKVAVIPKVKTKRIVVSGELLVLRPRPGVDPRLIWAFLRQKQIREELSNFMTGSAGHQRLSSDVLLRVHVPELEESTWVSGDLILKHLDTAAQLRLQTEDLTTLLPGSAAQHLSRDFPRLPLGDLDVELRYGTSERSVREGVLPVLRIPNVVNRRVTTEDLRFTDLGPDRRRDQLEPGDLLVVRTNGNVERLGRVAVYKADPNPATFASYLIRIRCRNVDPDFLWAWLQSPEIRDRLLAGATTTAGQYNLNIATLRALPIPHLDKGTEAAIADIARHARNLAIDSERQRKVLEVAIANHLTSLFRGRFSVGEEAQDVQTPRAAPVDFLPYVYEAASRRQKELWRLVMETEGAFGLAALGPEKDFARLQHDLALLEQLGVLIRDESEEAFRWRRPDPELELSS
jgi:type I restriction enzyme S subunit